MRSVLVLLLFLLIISPVRSQDSTIDEHINKFKGMWARAYSKKKRHEAVSFLFSKKHEKILEVAISLLPKVSDHDLAHEIASGISQYIGNEKGLDALAEKLKTLNIQRTKDNALMCELLKMMEFYQKKARKHKDLIIKFLSPHLLANSRNIPVMKAAVKATEHVKHNDFVDPLIKLAHNLLNRLCRKFKAILPKGG
jgi:hypothetical protein